MRPSRTDASPKDRPAVPARIVPYLAYAQENLKRSRMLFKKGDLRYAAFSANEGLELSVKAYMLHYKIIDEAEAARHFPYPAAVKKMVEITESSIGRDPPNGERRKQALEALDVLGKAFAMMAKKELRTQLWKSSMRIRLADGNREQFDRFRDRLLEWNEKMLQVQGAQQQVHEQDHAICTPDVQSNFFATVLGLFREKSGRRKSSEIILLPGGKKMQYKKAIELGQLIALAELFNHLGVIAPSFAHQQISRYPTQIDGIDSQKIYNERKADLKSLLKRIHAVSKGFLKHLECGTPLLVQNEVRISSDMDRFMQP